MFKDFYNSLFIFVILIGGVLIFFMVCLYVCYEYFNIRCISSCGFVFVIIYVFDFIVFSSWEEGNIISCSFVI